MTYLLLLLTALCILQIYARRLRNARAVLLEDIRSDQEALDSLLAGAGDVGWISKPNGLTPEEEHQLASSVMTHAIGGMLRYKVSKLERLDTLIQTTWRRHLV